VLDALVDADRGVWESHARSFIALVSLREWDELDVIAGDFWEPTLFPVALGLL
jgi:hypothetical protein